MNNKKPRRKIHQDKTLLDNIHTVEDLFTNDDINEMLRDAESTKTEIEHLIIIGQDKNGKIWSSNTTNSLCSALVYMLETTKISLVNEVLK